VPKGGLKQKQASLAYFAYSLQAQHCSMFPAKVMKTTIINGSKEIRI
jgi:hypothetical protein